MTTIVGVSGVGLESPLSPSAGLHKTAQLEVAGPGALKPPEPGEADSFARAIANPDVEMRASAPSDASIIQRDIGNRIEALSSHLSTWQNATPAPASAAAQPTAPTAASADVDSLTAQMKGAYTFAIETTLLSHGSTESTKIFNTLLKGQ